MLSASDVHEYRSIIWLGVFLFIVAICAMYAFWASTGRVDKEDAHTAEPLIEEKHPSFEETPSNW